jgi:hypothetical protein
VLILTSPEPRARSCRGIGQRRLGDQSGTANRAPGSHGSHGLHLPSMSNDTPGEVYVQQAARDASEAPLARVGAMTRERSCRCLSATVVSTAATGRKCRRGWRDGRWGLRKALAAQRPCPPALVAALLAADGCIVVARVVLAVLDSPAGGIRRLAAADRRLRSAHPTHAADVGAVVIGATDRTLPAIQGLRRDDAHLGESGQDGDETAASKESSVDHQSLLPGSVITLLKTTLDRRSSPCLPFLERI